MRDERCRDGGTRAQAIGAALEPWLGGTVEVDQPPVVPHPDGEGTLRLVVMPIGYCIGFDDYPFRVGWANGLLALQMLLVAMTLWRAPLVPVGPGVVGTDGEGHLVACIRAPLEAAVAGETIGAEVVR